MVVARGMALPCLSLRKFPCESVAGTAFLTVIVRPSIERVTFRSKSDAVTLSMRTRWPSTSRANRLSSPSITVSSGGELLMAGVTQDLEVGHRVVVRRNFALQAGEAREVGHGAPERREVGNRPELGRVQVRGEVLPEVAEDADQGVAHHHAEAADRGHLERL